jgi:hypothetical protein
MDDADADMDARWSDVDIEISMSTDVDIIHLCRARGNTGRGSDTCARIPHDRPKR